MIVSKRLILGSVLPSLPSSPIYCFLTIRHYFSFWKKPTDLHLRAVGGGRLKIMTIIKAPWLIWNYPQHFFHPYNLKPILQRCIYNFLSAIRWKVFWLRYSAILQSIFLLLSGQGFRLSCKRCTVLVEKQH